MMTITHIAWSKVYQFKSITFDWHAFLGPTFLRRKDHEHRDMDKIPLRLWGEFTQWYRLTDEQREQYRIF